jgi:N-acyl-D-amino-acid deacylase
VEDYRKEVKEAIRQGRWFIRVAYNPNTNPRWAENITVLEHKNKDTVNKTIADIAEERETDAFDTWLDLIAEDPDSKCAIATVYPSGTVDPDAPYHDIFYQHPASCVGVDTGVDDYKYEPKAPPWTVRGTNNYSAFVGFWEKFVNKEGSLTPEQAVHKTSTQAANRHSIKGRGVLKEGYYADIVLMNLPKMEVTGTPLDTRKQPKGIDYVIVNGVPVVENSKHTGATPGVVITRE